MDQLAELLGVARGAQPVPLTGEDRARIAAARAAGEAGVAEGPAVYGVPTGFGHLADVHIPPDQAAQLQVNLVRSHAVGSGEPLPEDVVRGMLHALAGSLRRGYSGVRPDVVELVLGMLEHGVTPVIPSRG